MAGMPELLGHIWIYRQAEGSELVLLDVAAVLEEPVCWNWKHPGGLIAYPACLG